LVTWSAFPRLETFDFADVLAFDIAGAAALRRGTTKEEAFNAALFVNPDVLLYANISLGLSADTATPTKFSDLVKFLYKAFRPATPEAAVRELRNCV